MKIIRVCGRRSRCAASADMAVLEEEVKDLRSSVVEIVTVLRNLKFYTDWEKLHYNVVLGDPDVAKSPTQTLVNISPAPISKLYPARRITSCSSVAVL